MSKSIIHLKFFYSLIRQSETHLDEAVFQDLFIPIDSKFIGNVSLDPINSRSSLRFLYPRRIGGKVFWRRWNICIRNECWRGWVDTTKFPLLNLSAEMNVFDLLDECVSVWEGVREYVSLCVNWNSRPHILFPHSHTLYQSSRNRCHCIALH